MYFDWIDFFAMLLLLAGIFVMVVGIAGTLGGALLEGFITIFVGIICCSISNAIS